MMKRLVLGLMILSMTVVSNRKVMAFSENLANDFGNWSFEESGTLENISKVATGWKVEAGGNVASTHYARIKYKVVEKRGVALKNFDVTGEFELPSDFYTKQKAGFRILNTDNFGVTVNGQKYGASGVDELRVGVYINSNHSIQLVSNYENYERNVLWTRTEPLSVGRHTIRMYGNVAENVPWGIVIDGKTEILGTGMLSPSSCPVEERVITRMVAGIDGAADQDMNAMSLIVEDVTLSDGTTEILVGDFNGDGKIDLLDFVEWKKNYLLGTKTLADFVVWKKAYLGNP